MIFYTTGVYQTRNMLTKYETLRTDKLINCSLKNIMMSYLISVTFAFFQYYGERNIYTISYICEEVGHQNPWSHHYIFQKTNPSGAQDLLFSTKNYLLLLFDFS